MLVRGIPLCRNRKAIITTALTVTALSSSQVVLVPYYQHHVPTYHDWMKDPDIQAATASEPLSLSEEYAMQQSWREDRDKLTFIVCLPGAVPCSPSNHAAEIAAMIGDVNMFVAYHDEADEPTSLVGELELMIATRNFQRKGLGRAGLLCFLAYVKQHEREIIQQFTDGTAEAQTLSGFDYLTAKIGESNERSLRLFESLGFARTSLVPNYFGEFELRLKELSMDVVKEQMRTYDINNYKEIEYKASTSAEQTSLGPGA